jgi:hypothetical protein
METVSNLTAQPILATLTGKQHKFRQLTLAELFGRFEAEVKSDWTMQVHELAKGMAGEDKIAYLSHEAAHPLSAENSVALVREKMNSAKGVALILSLTHLVEDKNDTLPEIISLMTEPADQIAVRGLVEQLTGTAGVKVEGGADSNPKA